MWFCDGLVGDVEEIVAPLEPILRRVMFMTLAEPLVMVAKGSKIQSMNALESSQELAMHGRARVQGPNMHT